MIEVSLDLDIQLEASSPVKRGGSMRIRGIDLGVVVAGVTVRDGGGFHTWSAACISVTGSGGSSCLPAVMCLSKAKVFGF